MVSTHYQYTSLYNIYIYIHIKKKTNSAYVAHALVSHEKIKFQAPVPFRIKTFS